MQFLKLCIAQWYWSSSSFEMDIKQALIDFLKQFTPTKCTKGSLDRLVL